MPADPARIAAAWQALADLGVSVADLRDSLEYRPIVPTVGEYLVGRMRGPGPAGVRPAGTQPTPGSRLPPPTPGPHCSTATGTQRGRCLVGVTYRHGPPAAGVQRGGLFAADLLRRRPDSRRTPTALGE
jgi:hypothetical protein